MQRSLQEQIPDAYARFKFRREALKEEYYGLKQLKQYGFAKTGLNTSHKIPIPWITNVHGYEVIAVNSFFSTASEPIYLDENLQSANWSIDCIPIIRCVYKTGQKHKPKYNAVYATGHIKRNHRTFSHSTVRYPNLPEGCLVVTSLAMPSCRMINHNINLHYHDMHWLRNVATLVPDCELGSVLSI